MNRQDPTEHSVVSAPLNAHPVARLIRDEIRQRHGWMRFERFMELALYTPGLGYYSSGRRVLGHMPQDGSDFVTAPELTSLFGQTLATQVIEALEATSTDEVWEFGAGSGALAIQLLGTLGDRIQRYTIVDLSGTLRDRQHHTLVKALPEMAHKVVWADSLPEQMQGVIVGNEVLDAMPVHLLTWTGEQWLERGVGLAGDGDQAAFAWADQPAPPGARAPTERADSEFIPGTVVETHGQAEAFIATLAQRMTRGAAFFIDYGFPEGEYYHPQRTGGTLMCHQGHQSDPNPLVNVGEKDITTHVNFTGIALSGQENGWEVLGYTTQGRFLSNCGLLAQMGKDGGDGTSAADFKTRAAAQMLIAEHEMGELFKVIGFVKGAWFDAIGFSQGDRTHTL